MPVLQKLNEVRAKFHSAKLKKTGFNTFAKYSYFQLSDFVVPALKLFNEAGLCSVVSFTDSVATMLITDLDDGTTVTITSPMSKAELKGCHEVQNLGAVQTYLRRYLWVCALEIIEHDALDMSVKQGKTSVRGAALEGISAKQAEFAKSIASSIRDYFERGDENGAYGELESALDRTAKKGGDEQLLQIAIYENLPPNQRKELDELKRAAQAKEAA